MGITKKQKEVYDYISNYLQENGYSPTQNEIKDYFGLKSLGSVQRYIKYLLDAGYLETEHNARRGLVPVGFASRQNSVDDDSYHSNQVSIPIYGSVAAGSPIEAINDNHDMIDVPAYFIKKPFDYFALTIQGDSMIEDGIYDEDLIICRHQKQAQIGQTVVALINNEATVKKYYPKKENIELHPANSSLKPIIVAKSQLQIAGVLVGLLRRY